MTPENLANLLGALGTMVCDKMDAAFVVDDLSPMQTAVLMLVAKYPGCLIKDLHEPLMLSHSACVRIVDKLVTFRLIERRKSDTDGRAVALRLTRHGRAMTRSSVRRREDALLHSISALDVKERIALSEIASKLLAVGNPSERSIGRTCRTCDYNACIECPFRGFGDSQDPA